MINRSSQGLWVSHQTHVSTLSGWAMDRWGRVLSSSSWPYPTGSCPNHPLPFGVSAFASWVLPIPLEHRFTLRLSTARNHIDPSNRLYRGYHVSPDWDTI